MLDITEADVRDLSSIIHLQRLSYQSEAELYNDWSLPPLIQTLESLHDELHSSCILKAMVRGKLVGSVRGKVDNHVFKIGRLIVHPEFQKQGIGSCLLRYIESLQQNVTSFELFTGSKSTNNIRFYERHGYHISHTQSLSDTIAITYLVKTLKTTTRAPA